MTGKRLEWTCGVAVTLSIVLGQALVVAQDANSPAQTIPSAVKPERDPLLDQVELAVAVTSRRQLTAGVHTPWQVVHGILALRQKLMLKKPEGGEISGIEWMASGALHNGQTMFEVTPYGGRGRPFTKPYAFEGHPTQFMGYMAMCDLPLDYQFKADKGTITVGDIINDAKMQVHEGPEVTWTLWALAHYLPSDAQWINARGEAWSIERLMQIETRNAVLNAACGGTHGLFALSYARNKYLANGKPLQGVWLEADQKIKRYLAEARALQNPDGSFSAAYFRGPQYSTDFATRLPANGHILELLMVALPERQINEPWVRKAVERLSKDLIDNRKTPADCGPLYHAVHALKLYNFRANPAAKDYHGTPAAPAPVPTITDAEALGAVTEEEPAQEAKAESSATPATE